MHLLLCQGGQWSYIRVVSGLYQPLSSGRRVGLVRWGKVNSMEQYEVSASVTILAGFPTELHIIIIIIIIVVIIIIIIIVIVIIIIIIIIITLYIVKVIVLLKVVCVLPLASIQELNQDACAYTPTKSRWLYSIFFNTLCPQESKFASTIRYFKSQTSSITIFVVFLTLAIFLNLFLGLVRWSILIITLIIIAVMVMVMVILSSGAR